MSSHLFIRTLGIFDKGLIVPQYDLLLGLPRWCSDKESNYQCTKCKGRRFDPWARKIPWRRKWQPTPVFSPEKYQGKRSLAVYSLWGCKESDTTEPLNNNDSRKYFSSEWKVKKYCHWNWPPLFYLGLEDWTLYGCPKECGQKPQPGAPWTCLSHMLTGPYVILKWK